MRSRRWRGARLVPAVGVAWACAGAATLLPGIAPVAAAVLWLTCVAGVAGMLRRPARALAIAVVACAAGAAVCSHVALAQPGRDEAAGFAGPGGRVVTIEATVSGAVAAGTTGEVWFDASAHDIRVGERALRVAQPVTVGVGAEHVPSLAGAGLGATVRVRGSVLPADPGERSVITMRASGPVEVVSVPPGVLGALVSMRASLVASAGGLPDPGGALVPGLAVGDTSGVDDTLDAAMKTSSLSHLTAVSGANCAIVVGMAFGLAAVCGAARGVRVAAGMAALALFVLLVTPEPSVVRAGAMAAIAMLAVALGRAGAGLATLCLAVTVLLVVDPWLASSLGFALSAVATASLLVLARPLADGLARWMPRAPALAIAVPLAAQLACAPLIVLIDPHVPLLGVLANLLAAPAAPIATVAGFFAALATPFPWVQDGLVAIAWLPASWIAGIARTVAGIPAQYAPWLDGLPGALLLALVCGAAVAAIALRPGRGRARGVARLAAVGVVGVVAGVGGGTAALQTVAGSLTVPSAWRIAVCDVGQGDAVLIRSGDAVALVDAGPDPVLLTRCLERFGVSRLDLVVLTHFDLDHVGGVAAVHGRTGLVLHGPPEPGDGALELLADGGATLVEASAGRTGALGAARWQVRWPAADTVTPGNDASVVVEVFGDDLPRTLLLGDLAAEPQARLRASARDVDVVKVAHHGSADQDPGLYDRLDAELAVIPVGADNDYGHPRASLLSMLAAQGTAVARTDTDGAVALWMDGGVLQVWRERGVGGAG